MRKWGSCTADFNYGKVVAAIFDFVRENVIVTVDYLGIRLTLAYESHLL